jgi:hypothetical protein
MQPTIELQRVFTELKSKTRTNLEKQKTIEDLKILYIKFPDLSDEI